MHIHFYVFYKKKKKSISAYPNEEDTTYTILYTVA